MPEKNDQKKIELHYARNVVREIRKELNNANLKFDNLKQIFNLSRKILFWYKRHGENDEQYDNKVQNNEEKIPILVESIKMLWAKKEDGTWKFKRQRSGFLDSNSLTSSRILVPHLISFRSRELVKEKNLKLMQERSNLLGLENIFSFGSYNFVKISGNKEDKAKVLKFVTEDMGNCLGGVLIDYYLDRTENFLDIYLIRDSDGKFVVALEYNNKTRNITQIEGNAKLTGRTKIFDTDAVYISFIYFLLEFIRSNNPTAIHGIQYMEDVGQFLNKVITRDGNIKFRNEVKTENILWPTPTFSRSTEFQIDNLDFDKYNIYEFFKQRKPKIDKDRNMVEAGIIFDQEIDTFIGSITIFPLSPRYYTLQERVSDSEILSILDIRCNQEREVNRADFSKLWSIHEIKKIIENQLTLHNGTPPNGPLCTNIVSNIFYLKDSNNRLYSLHCMWEDSKKSWIIRIYDSPSISGLNGNRIFSRE